jgi:hypothetical protein
MLGVFSSWPLYDFPEIVRENKGRLCLCHPQALREMERRSRIPGFCADDLGFSISHPRSIALYDGRPLHLIPNHSHRFEAGIFGTGCEFLDGKIEILFWNQSTRSIQANNSGKLSNHIKG